MGLRHVVCAGIGAMVVPAAALAQGGAGAAERNWAAISECGAITDSGRRLQCMDDVLRQAGVLGSGAIADRQRPPEQGRDDQAAPAMAAAQPAARRAQSAAAQPSRASQPALGDDGQMTTSIASIRTIGYQRLLVTTAEGSVWEQTEEKPFLTVPKAGDAFSVQSALFGSYRCRFNESSRYRCKPVE
jgi:hypothetical protein